MKKLILSLLLTATPLTVPMSYGAVAAYNASEAKANAQSDVANWMSYLPDDVFVAHVSIPGTHDTATAEGWKSSTGPNYSTTQSVKIDEQLAQGIRAFDFRPGLVSDELWCNHGVDQTTLKLADAFTKLKNYLDAHPSEFFVMHLFRGNVYNKSGDAGAAALKGGKDDDASRQKYNELFNALFNEGQFADYFVEYSPYLKVGDVRGKIIVFRRDRIEFAHVFKAGNLSNWPADNAMWDVNNKVTVSLDMDGTVKGNMHVTDVFSPDNATELETEKASIAALFKNNCTQAKPNDAKRAGTYKPDWSMIFTSGAYGGENTEGYRKNAAVTNPYFTELIQTADPKGPTGIVLSDWVLTDESNGHKTMGVNLVPAIYLNNFDYIADYILDDELFAQGEVEQYWDEDTEYFIRNKGTGEFLSAGADYGTRAVINKEGLPVKFKYDKNNQTYSFLTTLSNTTGSQGGLGENYFTDNPSLANFIAKRESAGIFSFTLNGNAMAAVTHPNTYPDGTVYWVDASDYDSSDPMQLWEVIPVDQYFNDESDKATKNNPVDISYIIKGHKFRPNDSENWTGTTNYHEDKAFGIVVAKQYSEIITSGTNEWYDKDLALQLTHSTYSTSGQKGYTAWSLNHKIPLERAGIYKLRFKTGYYAINTTNSEFKYNVNGVDIRPLLKDETKNIDLNIGSNDAAEAIKKFREDPDKYTIEFDYNFDENSEIVFDMSYAGGKTVTSVYLDDIELIYYGPDPSKKYAVLIRAMEDATRRVNEMGAPYNEGWEELMAQYRQGIENLEYFADGSNEALEIYEMLRQKTYSQTLSDDKELDFTNAFINAGFETGTMLGWETSFEGSVNTDTGVRLNEGVYDMDGGVNKYLFNTWQQDPDPDNDGRGTILSQTITGLPAGHYVVTAEAANDENMFMYISVNGQQSEPINLVNNKGKAEIIHYEFEVADLTEEVTVSFMGANADGSYDEFGGNWYKLDDVHLYRKGSQNVCVFYKRLQDAIDRANLLVETTLPEKYQAQWDTSDYNDLMSQHLKDGHKPELGETGDIDPMHSNGFDQMTTLFSRLSQLALSQNETNSNMSAAIRNNSFELGDLSYWNVKAQPISDSKVTDEDEYSVEGKDDKYLFYSNYENKAYPIYQTVENVPVGRYRLTALVASDAGNEFFLAVNGTPGDKLTTTGANKFDEAVIEFDITEENPNITLGLYPAIDHNFLPDAEPEGTRGPWYAVDNFNLTFVGKEISIDWEMETDTHGTLILPFDHEIPEDLKVYSLTSHHEATAEGTTHHILDYTEHSEIKANTPYVVERIADSGAKNVKASKLRREAAGESTGSGHVYTFTGFTTHERDIYTDGLLTGTLTTTKASDGDHHLQDYEGNIGFVLHEKGVEHASVAPYHAYITLPEAEQNPDNPISGLYFDEPTLPLVWEMENDAFGTIILPFEAEIPAEFEDNGLKIYTLSLPEDKTETVDNIEYQVITKTEISGNVFEANVPYMVMKAEEESENGAEKIVRFRATRAGEDDPAEDNPFSYTFNGIATNDASSYKPAGNLLTGVLADTEVKGDDRVLSAYDDKACFLPVGTDEDTNHQTATIATNHAYVKSGSDSNLSDGTLLLFEAPQNDSTGIKDILSGEAGNVDIYTLDGVLLRSDVAPVSALRELAPGIYLLRAGDRTLKVMK